MKYGKCKCENCGNLFKIKPKEKVVSKVKIVFLECPQCKQRYLSYVEDAELKERMDRVTQIELDKRRTFIRQNRVLMKKKIKQYQHLVDKIVKPKKSKENE